MISGGDFEDSSSGAETAGSPRRGEDLPSFYGPGASRVKRGQFPPVVFKEGGWEVPDSETPKIKAVAAYLRSSAERVILAGGAGVDDPEYARQLGQQRALAVQRALVKQGIPVSTILTASYGQDLPGRGRDRVEFGFILTDAPSAAVAER